MEKFAIDLDRVLDEFEYNEDCAEQMARRGRRRYEYDTHSSEEINQYTQGETSKSSHEEHRNVEPKEPLQTEYPTHVQVVNADSLVTRKFVDGILHYEEKLRDLNESNSKRCSSKFVNMNTSNVKLGEPRNSLHCKLNVSGVFSCLNEYINTGSASLHIGEIEHHLSEENRNDDMVDTNDSSHCTVISDKSHSSESETDEHYDEKQSASFIGFQQHPNQHSASSSLDHQEVLLSSQHNGEVLLPKNSSIQYWNGDSELQSSSWEEHNTLLGAPKYGDAQEKYKVEASDNFVSSIELIGHTTDNFEHCGEQIEHDDNMIVKSVIEFKDGCDVNVTEKRVPDIISQRAISAVPAVFKDNEEYSEEFLNMYLNNLETCDDNFSSLDQCINSVTTNIVDINKIRDHEASGFDNDCSSNPAVLSDLPIRTSICPTTPNVCVSVGDNDPVANTVNSFNLPASIPTSITSNITITTPAAIVAPQLSLSPSTSVTSSAATTSISTTTTITPSNTTTTASSITPITTVATTITLTTSTSSTAFLPTASSSSTPSPSASNLSTPSSTVAPSTTTTANTDITAIPCTASTANPNTGSLLPLSSTTVQITAIANTTATSATATTSTTTTTTSTTTTTTAAATATAATTTATMFTTTTTTTTTAATINTTTSTTGATIPSVTTNSSTITGTATSICTVATTDTATTTVTKTIGSTTHTVSAANGTVATATDTGYSVDKDNTSIVMVVTSNPSPVPVVIPADNLISSTSNLLAKISATTSEITSSDSDAGVMVPEVSVPSTYSVSTHLCTIATDKTTFAVPASPVNCFTTFTSPISEHTTCLTPTSDTSVHSTTGSATSTDFSPENANSHSEAFLRDCASETVSGQQYSFVMHEDQLLSSESSPKVNTVASIECQEMKRNVEILPANSFELNTSNSVEQLRIQTGAETDVNNDNDNSVEICSPSAKHVLTDNVGNTSAGTSHSYHEKRKDKTSSEQNPTNNADGDSEIPNVQPQLRLDLQNTDYVEKMDTGADGIDPVVDDIASLATGEDLALSSPDTSETSSVEVAAQQILASEIENSSNEVGYMSDEQNKLGRIRPFWVPDDQAPSCMFCCCKFTVLKRRHHCRACGKVLCSKCCCMKYRLDYLNSAEVRVCLLCHDILVRGADQERGSPKGSSDTSLSDSNSKQSGVGRQPNPNNPMEYCSTIPPLEQAASALSQPVPSVLVPVGVLKREGSARLKSDVAKQVMFSDGIRPGGDLTEVDSSSEQRILRQSDMVVKRVSNLSGTAYTAVRLSRSFDIKAKSFISTEGLPPLAVMDKGNLNLEDVPFRDMTRFLSSLRCETNPPAVFALNQNLFVKVKILNLDCCVNRVCWCFSTEGMSCVSQDEIVIILECLPEDNSVPTDVFHFLNTLYHDASKGVLVAEMGHTVFKNSMFLGSSDHGGFLYIRPSFQCLHKIILPTAPYLVGILIHRWEIPWAKLFPIRLMLRLGAEFRYYPCMLVSVQQREPVYCEIGHTIMNLLADFRNMSYTLPSVPGMVIHMEDRHTSILLPKNRYDQVSRALNNSNDHVLALAANFSLEADSHLVCIQSPTDDSYHTQAINIHNKPRKVTGASFVVFNGALKISSNLMAKSTIVEDGLMVQITPDMIQELRSSLHKMKDFVVCCGPISTPVPDETVDVRWIEEDRNFNIGVRSVIDGLALDGVPSIRVHNGSDFMGKTRFIRWTEVFILQPGSIGDGMIGANDTVDVSHIAENLAAATCMALCDFLDLLAQSGFTRLAVRANIHHDNVGYSVGSQGEKLPPIYMKTLDSTLVPVLHRTATVISNSSPVVLELLFHVMLQ